MLGGGIAPRMRRVIQQLNTRRSELLLDCVSLEEWLGPSIPVDLHILTNKGNKGL
jgi:hypothetical protein